MNEVELLAPAGSEDNFFGAVNYGADAVYLGLSQFSARKKASNFTLEKLPYYIAYAHLFGVKVYVAVNTVIKNSELSNYLSTISSALKCGADAFIVQDIFLGRTLKQLFPNIVLHLSTQAGVNNVDGAKQAIAFGFKRVILARETNVSEIKKISQIIETEVFVHGALCTCFSGHCYFSSFIGGQSGNRGACRQPCRKLYKYEGTGIGDKYRYALSLGDLALHKRIDELITAGVKSFKIEGRMRGFEYVSTACDFYRELIDGNFNKHKFDAIKRFYNRGNFTEGLSFGQDKNLISDKIQSHAGVVVAKISKVSGNKLLLSSIRHKIAEGDCFKILQNGREIGNAIAVTENGKIVVKFNNGAAVGCDLAITKDVMLARKLREKRKLYPVKSALYARIGEKLKLTVNGNDFYSDYEVESALTNAVTKSEIKENLRKIDIYPFDVSPSCDLIEQVFIPKKILNSLRATAYKNYFYSFAYSDDGSDLQSPTDFDYFIARYADNSQSVSQNNAVTVISHNFNFNFFPEFANFVFCPNDYNDLAERDTFFEQTKKSKAVKYLYVPPFLSEEDQKIIKEFSDGFDGIYCEGAFGIFLAKRLKKRFFAGVELNVTNDISYSVIRSEGANEIAISKELSDRENVNSNAWRLTFGDIKIMSLIYCPFGKNCANCNKSNVFTLKDEAGREFAVRRYKLSSCRFEVYNNALLKSKKKFANEIFDFTMHNDDEINQLITIYKKDNKQNLKIGFTIGNFAKGVE